MDRHCIVKFYNDAQRDDAASRAEGRPIFKDVEMVEIRFPGDRESTIIAPAHDQAFLNRSSEGPAYLTYAERFAEPYKAFKERGANAQVGTPLDMLVFLAPSQIAEMHAQNIFTVENLAGLSDRMMKGPGWREWREQAQAFLDNAQSASLLAAEQAKSAALEARLAALEAAMAAKSSEGDEWDAMDDDALREALEARGLNLRANASRASMLKAARALEEA